MMKFLQRKSILLSLATVVFLSTLSVFSYINVPVAHASQVTDCATGTNILAFGRSAYCGYFNQAYDTRGGFVFTNGLASSSLSDFENIILSRYNSGTTQEKTGAAFIISTMLGKNGAAGNRTVTAAETTEWRARLANFDGTHSGYTFYNSIAQDWSCGQINSYYQGSAANDDAFYTTSTASNESPNCGNGVTVSVIKFQWGGGNYIIKRNCGNILGSSVPLPAPIPNAATLQGYKTNFTTGANGTSANFGNAAVTLKRGATIINPNPTAAQDCPPLANNKCNPFHYTDIAPVGVSLTFTTTAVAGYTIKGYKICDSVNTSCSVTVTSGYVANSTATFTLVSGHTYNFRWFYNPVATTDVASCTITGAPATATPSQTFTAIVAARNGGTNTWTSAAGYSLVDNGAPTGLWGPTNIALPTTPSSYPNGSTANFVINSTAPSAPGTYTFAWIMNRPSNPRFASGCSQTITVTGVGVIKIGKIYGANFITAVGTAVGDVVRDNFALQFRVLTYMWPDTGTRIRNNGIANRHYWESGLYGNAARDNGSASSARADPNSMGPANFNKFAEQTYCPDYVQCKLPLGYVTQADSLGDTTPNGNHWYGILKNLYNESYYDRMGGIASSKPGTLINNIETSNVHVGANGLAADTQDEAFQGGVGDNVLQGNAQRISQNYNADGLSHYMPGGSQGPRKADASGEVAWDNIRNPTSAGSGFNAIINSNANLDFSNTVGSPANFTDDPDGMLAIFDSIKSQRSLQYGSVDAVSLLQDGKDKPDLRQYPARSEPLSYTTTLDSAQDVKLKWDEYADWSQKDDKGHYYTSRATLATGIDQGAAVTNATATTYSARVTNGGSAVTTTTTVGYNYLFSSSCSPGGAGGTYYRAGAYFNYSGYTYNGCGYTSSTPVTDTYTTTQSSSTCTSSTQPTSFAYTTNTKSYSTGSIASGYYGWVRSDIIGAYTGYAPSGTTQGGTAGSYFYPTRDPSWSHVSNYWQPKSLPGGLGGYANGNNNGLTNRAATELDYSQKNWVFDQSDPVYTNRYVFDGSTTPAFTSGWNYDYSQSCVYYYPNGSGTIDSTTSPVATYYPSATYMYESTTNPTTPVGLYNFTYDGNKDNVVDNGWIWQPNVQLVRYEQTYPGHSRDLGARCRIPVGGCNQLFGLDGNNTPIRPDRGVATIYNPTIAAENADIFSAGDVDSYFTNSGLSSAFIFANGTIQNFSSSGAFAGYYNNPSTRSKTFFDNADPVHAIFETKFDGPNNAYSGSSIGNLGGKIYRYDGDLTIGTSTVCGGAGTIYVNGNLTISGDLNYCGGTSKADLPSLGIVVNGNIQITSNVHHIVGAYFAGGSFSSGSVLSDDGSDRTTGDRGGASPYNGASLTVDGLVVARKINLQRQPLGIELKLGLLPEKFSYDGRVVVVPPPGFTYLFTAPAAWNEGIPYTGR